MMRERWPAMLLWALLLSWLHVAVSAGLLYAAVITDRMVVVRALLLAGHLVGSVALTRKMALGWYVLLVLNGLTLALMVVTRSFQFGTAIALLVLLMTRTVRQITGVSPAT